jgi:hypothetical protein
MPNADKPKALQLPSSLMERLSLALGQWVTVYLMHVRRHRSSVPDRAHRMNLCRRGRRLLPPQASPAQAWAPGLDSPDHR